MPKKTYEGVLKYNLRIKGLNRKAARETTGSPSNYGKGPLNDNDASFYVVHFSLEGQNTPFYMDFVGEQNPLLLDSLPDVNQWLLNGLNCMTSSLAGDCHPY